MKGNTVFIQNLISPYRNRFFNALNSAFEDFSVYYMGLSEPDRNWDTSALIRKYDSWIDDSGVYVTIGWFDGHINPKLLKRVLFDKNIKNIVLAVSWTDPNIIAIAFAKKFHLTHKRLFFWAEANYTAEWTKKHNSKLKWWLKRAVFNSIDGGLVIPGKMSEITFEKWGISVSNYLHLPNTIDDSTLHFDDTQRSNDSLPVFIMPIRVIESVKGGLNFFKSIGEENIKMAKFIIAGDGIDRQMYEDYIKDNNFEDNIVMAGFCNSDKMTELYNRANAFVLPSYSDPSPLSVVEALFFHLPVLCSNHCGNHFEAVREGVNGFTFSPLEPKNIKHQFEVFMSKMEQWDKMGNQSYCIYQEKFDTEKVVNAFVAKFKALAI